MKMIDLFCGAGGAAVGYHRAGFEVVGVDNRNQKNYPFKFHKADALEFLLNNYKKFDVVHASPPCQKWSVAGQGCAATLGKQYPDLIHPLKQILNKIGIPYIIENVPHTPIRPDVILYGYCFGLPIIRQRWFEIGNGIWLMNPIIPKSKLTVSDGDLVTVAGQGSSMTRRRRGKVMVYENKIKFWKGSVRKTWSHAMGIDWMTTKELSQAIPPAYTEYIGNLILEQLINNHGKREVHPNIYPHRINH